MRFSGAPRAAPGPQLPLAERLGLGIGELKALSQIAYISYWPKVCWCLAGIEPALFFKSGIEPSTEFRVLVRFLIKKNSVRHQRYCCVATASPEKPKGPEKGCLWGKSGSSRSTAKTTLLILTGHQPLRY